MKIFMLQHKITLEANYFMDYAIAELIADNYNKNLANPQWLIKEIYINNSQPCPTNGICEIDINYNCDCDERFKKEII